VHTRRGAIHCCAALAVRSSQSGRRKNLAVHDGQGRLTFLYRMNDLAITHYCTRNYPTPYINADGVVTQIEGEEVSPFKATAWLGGSWHAEW